MNFLACTNKLVSAIRSVEWRETRVRLGEKNMSRTLPTTHGARKKMIFIIIIIVS